MVAGQAGNPEPASAILACAGTTEMISDTCL